MNSDINVYLGREKPGIMRKRALLLRKGCSFEITRVPDRVKVVDEAQRKPREPGLTLVSSGKTVSVGEGEGDIRFADGYLMTASPSESSQSDSGQVISVSAKSTSEFPYESQASHEHYTHPNNAWWFPVRWTACVFSLWSCSISYRISEQRAAQSSAWWWCSAALVQSVLRADKHWALITAICGSIALHQPGRLANGWPSAPLNNTGSPPRSDPRKHRPPPAREGRKEMKEKRRKSFDNSSM
ncbi:unnamed protein product [Boreogadus saida]